MKPNVISFMLGLILGYKMLKPSVHIMYWLAIGGAFYAGALYAGL